jgi:hypothetical protein
VRRISHTHQASTHFIRTDHTHRHGSALVTPARLWVHYQETCASVPEEKGDGHGNTAEVDGDDRHPGNAALGQRGTRVCMAGRAWGRRPRRRVAWGPRGRAAWRPRVGRPSGWYRHRHWTVLGAVLGAILGRILETLCLWLPLCLPLWLCLPAGGCRPIDPGLSPTPTPGVRSASSISLLVLL